MGDSDDFGDDFGDDTGDLEIEHDDGHVVKIQANPTTDSGSLFGGEDGDLDIQPSHAPDRRHGVAGAPPQRPSAPMPSHRRASGSDGLFSDGDDDRDGLSLYGDDDGDIEIDHAHPARPRLTPPPPANYTDPSMSLDANDEELAELLGDAHTRAPQVQTPALPPRPAPAQAIAPPPRSLLPEPAGSISLGAEDSELAELLGEGSGVGTRPPPPPPPPPPAAPQQTRKISFQEPPAAPAVVPHTPRGPAPVPSRPAAAPRDEDFDDVHDDEGDFGLTADADREVAQIASQGSRSSHTPGHAHGIAGGAVRGGNGSRQTFRSPAPEDSVADDFASDLGEEPSLDARRPGAARPVAPTPPRGSVAPAAGASFKRVAQQDSGAYSDDPYDDSFDSPAARGGRPPPRGIAPRGFNKASSEDAGGDDYEDEPYGDSMYDSRDGDGGGGGRGPAFHRVPAPDAHRTPHQAQRPQAPGPYDEDPYDDDYDDEDDFADDMSWDGEIRHTRGAYHAGGRPGSAGEPRSRGPHATGSRRRPLSALAPRERQAAMLEDMMSRHPSTWDIREVATWVEYIGMGQYRAKFVHHSVDGTLLLGLGEPELARDLRILPLGHRRALLGAIAELREAAQAAEKQRAERGLPPAAAQRPKTEAERIALLRERAGQQEGMRRPSSAGANVIPPEPYLGPATGKMTVYEQRAKLLYQLDKARHRAAQHAAIIEQLANNKALTEAQMADLRGKLKDLEAKHKDVLSPAGRSPGMTAPVSPGGSAGGGHRRGAAALAEAEYGADAAVPWLPVGRGTRHPNTHPERFARTGEDPGLDLTFRPRTLRVQDVPYGAVRDIVAKALSSRVPFWRRMDFEFDKMRKEREAREEARRKRRERMGLARRGGGGEGEDEEQAKSKHWNNYWVPGSNKNSSYHKHFKRGSENEELRQYRSFAKDKTRLSRWFKRFVDDGESTEGDVALERLINRMIKALVKTKGEMDMEIGESFEKRIRRYFEERGYKFATHTSNTIQVRARGTRAPGPARPDATLYDFEEVEQYYPDYLKKKTQAAPDDDGGGGGEDEETRMVPKRTTWKRLIAMYYMDRQKKIRAAIAMVKMSQFVQRHGVRWPPERDRDNGKKAVWVPNSNAGALHQLDGRDRTFNKMGQENIGLNVKLKKALGPPQPVTFQMRMMELEAVEAKADAMFAALGWPHSSGDPALGPPQEPLLLPEEEEDGHAGGGGDEFGLDGQGDEGFGLDADAGGGAGGKRRPRQGRAPALDFYQALDALLSRSLELRRLHDEWVESWRVARERGYGEDLLPLEPPHVEDLDWSGDPLMTMQHRAMERQRQQWLLEWEKARRLRERRAARMRGQGYREEDIELKLGRQQEAHEVDSSVINHLLRHVELLARLKPADLARFREQLKGTKKKMAVYRALCNQMFIDEARDKQAAREATLRSIYDSLRIGRHKVLSPAQEDAVVRRMATTHVVKRENTLKKLVSKQLEEEASSLTPWYMLRPPSRPVSRAVSPDRSSQPPGTTPRGRARSPGARGPAASGASTPRPRSAQKARPASPGPSPGGPGTGDGSSRSKYVFGSSTPKSMWGPMGPVRKSTGPKGGGAGGGGGSLLDSPGLLGLQSVVTQGGSPGRTRTGQGAATPTRRRPSTPTRSSAGGASRSGGPGGAAASPAPPSRPRSAAPSSAPRPSGGGASTTTAATNTTLGVAGRRPTSAAPASPGSRTRPASPASSRRPAGPPVSPRPRSGSAANSSKVAFAAPPPGSRPSAGGAGPPPPRRGLLDGDTTSGASASPSPERMPARAQPAGTNGRGGDGGGDRTGAAHQRKGLVDTDSSPSPPPQRRPAGQAPAPAAGSASTPVAGAAAPPGPSRQSSQASSLSGLGGRSGSGSAPGPAAGSARSQGAAGAEQRQASTRSSQPVTSPQGPSRQASASSGLGLGPGPVGGAAAGPTRGSRSGSGSGTGSSSGAAAGAPASKRPSTPPSPLGPQASGAELGAGPSQRSLQSHGSGSSSRGGPGGGVAGTSGSGGATAIQRPSPLSRSPQPASSPVGSMPPSPRGAPAAQRSGPVVQQLDLEEDDDTGTYGDDGFDVEDADLDLGGEDEF